MLKRIRVQESKYLVQGLMQLVVHSTAVGLWAALLADTYDILDTVLRASRALPRFIPLRIL